MFYELNVSLEGVHFFATAARSLTDESSAREMLALFRIKFPESEGYSVMVTKEIRACTRMEWK